MATFIEQVKTLINDNIKANGVGAITGPVLNDVLQAVMSAMDTFEQREARNARTINNGCRVVLNYLWNVEGASSSYKYNTSWDSAQVAILDGISSLVVEGATPSRFCFFSSAEIDYAHSLGTNLTGKIPTGAKYCVINLQKSSNVEGYDKMIVRQIQKEGFKKLSLLSIGNSYSQDALAYVPYILSELVPNLEVEIGILYMSGATITQHYNNFTNDATAYTFYRFNGSTWLTTSNQTIKNALDLHPWDILMMQQGSTFSWDWSKFSDLGNLVNAVTSYINYPVKLAWMVTQNRPKNGTTVYTPTEFAQHWTKIAENAQRVMNEYPFEILFPVGTAVENARGTSLNSIGDYGQLTYEGAHLQEGLPCQLASYAVILPLLDAIGEANKGVLAEATRATSTWLSGKNIPGPNGSSVGVTDANVQIAQKCAVMAHKFPFEVKSIV